MAKMKVSATPSSSRRRSSASVSAAIPIGSASPDFNSNPPRRVYYANNTIHNPTHNNSSSSSSSLLLTRSTSIGSTAANSDSARLLPCRGAWTMTACVLGAAVVCYFLGTSSTAVDGSGASAVAASRAQLARMVSASALDVTRHRLIQALPSDTHDVESDASIQTLRSMLSSTATAETVQHLVFTPSERRTFLKYIGPLCYDGTEENADIENLVLLRYDELPTPQLQIELWKYCALLTGYATAYLELGGVSFLQTFEDTFLNKSEKKNYAVLVDTAKLTATSVYPDNDTALGLAHGGILVLQPDSYSPHYTSNKKKDEVLLAAESVTKGMIQLLMETSNEVLVSRPLLLPRQLYRLVLQANKSHLDNRHFGNNSNGGWWELWQTKCFDLADPSSSSAGAWDNLSVSQEFSAPLVKETDVLLSFQRHLHSQAGDSAYSLMHTSVTPDANSMRVTHHCTRDGNAPCCEVKSSGSRGNAVLFLQHPVLAPPPTIDALPSTVATTFAGNSENNSTPFSRAAGSVERLPYLYHFHSTNSFTNDDVKSLMNKYQVSAHDMAYMSTIRVTTHHRLGGSKSSSTSNTSPEQSTTPNFFDLLLENDCLPTAKDCQRCLKRVSDDDTTGIVTGGDCIKCRSECGCYCTVLCKIRPPPKITTKTLTVHPPLLKKNAERLVPRIVHQTWFEPVTNEAYPNMSRLIQSWKNSGWEYNFYNDEAAADFISLHFPNEVRDAYDSIIPGAFKADLFRYCVLLIRGGVYADMDVLLEANLDAVVANDVGFMTPIDEPGIKVNRRSCLWNGLIAVAPGHPFLAKTIEMVVNNIRNRFTSVDYDDMLCPDPVLHVSHSVDTLFTCGPCILGAGINTVLGRHMQDQFEIGDVDIWQTERRAYKKQSTDASLWNIVVDPEDPRLSIPGRTIILQQNKNDMGAHRFTWVEHNVMFAATDMPDYDDRPPSKEHYSKTHIKAGVYGVKKLYTNNISADEKIEIVVGKVHR